MPIHTRISTTPASTPFGELTTRWFHTGLQGRVCGAYQRGHLELLLCGELGLQILAGAPRSDDPAFVPNGPVLAWASARVGLAAVWWFHPRVGARLDVAPGLHLRPKGYRVTDHLLEDTSNKRSLIEIGFPHAAFGLGIDIRLSGRKPG